MLESKTRVPEGICGCIRLTTEIPGPIYPASYPVENLSLCPDARTFSLIALSVVVGENASSLNALLTRDEKRRRNGCHIRRASRAVSHGAHPCISRSLEKSPWKQVRNIQIAGGHNEQPLVF